VDLLSFGFVLLIGLVSAGIAYAADRLGKKLGKKRLSVRVGRYSIRPKHVASLGTAGMGFVVSVLTILFVALVSRDAREWLVEGRQLLVQLGERKKEVKQLEGESLQLTAEKGQLVRQKDLLTRQYGELQGRYGVLDKRVGALNKKVLGLNASLTKSQLDYIKSQGDLQKSRQALEKSQASLRAKRSEFLLAQAQLSSKKAELAKTEKNLATAISNVQTVNKQLQAALKKSFDTYKKVQELEAQVVTLKKDVEDREAVAETLRKQTAALIAERDDAESKVKAAQARFDELQAQLTQVSKNVAELQGLAQQQYLFIATTFRSSRLEPLTFRANEEVARQPLAGGTDQAAALNALTSLLRSARAEATTRGAKPNRRDGKMQYDVADVFNHQDQRTGVPVSGDDLKRAVVAQATGKLEDQVLIATSTLNAFAGEPVSLEIRVVPNPVVYHRNEVVAEARIDGSLEEDRILDQLSEFVRSRVRERAQQDRMIPKSGTDAPFGEVKTSEVLSIVREVKRVGRSVRVQAFAEDDTRAADALRLGFRVR